MGIFPLPQSVLDRINASCRNFLWGKADIDKNKPLVVWSVVCSPKKEGGFGSFSHAFHFFVVHTDSLNRGRSTSGVQGKFCCLAIAITVYCI